jgi:hypothetical protein
MLSDPALALIRDIFGKPSLFVDLPRIERRVVAWGEGAEPTSLPHSAVVVSERFLLESLGSGDDEPGDAESDFTVFASRPLPDSVAQHNFGERRAAAIEVKLRRTEDAAACWIEATNNGWLFLIPNRMEGTWLLAVGAAAGTLLAESRLIAPRVEVLNAASGEFAACPRIVSPLCGDRWLACGSAAMAFDPICGDGTANAVREAILAAAVIRAIAGGGDRQRLLAHYQRRLVAGMQKHLALCAGFYRSGGNGAWWRSELAQLRQGFDWCGQGLHSLAEGNYRLSGFELEAVP